MTGISMASFQVGGGLLLLMLTDGLVKPPPILASATLR